jgi:hypothetical protein
MNSVLCAIATSKTVFATEIRQYDMLRFIGIVIAGILLGAATGYFGQCTSGTCPLTSTWWRGAIYGGIMALLLALGTLKN